MRVGMTGYKGDVNLQITPSISDDIDKLVDANDDRQTVIDKVAQIIDRKIHQNYLIFPHNYVAMDNLKGNTENLGIHYTQEEKKDFETYVAQQIGKIDLENKDIPFLEERFWTMYGNPLINQIAANS